MRILKVFNHFRYILFDRIENVKFEGLMPDIYSYQLQDPFKIPKDRVIDNLNRRLNEIYYH